MVDDIDTGRRINSKGYIAFGEALGYCTQASPMQVE